MSYGDARVVAQGLQDLLTDHKKLTPDAIATLFRVSESLNSIHLLALFVKSLGKK